MLTIASEVLHFILEFAKFDKCPIRIRDEGAV